jgi:hypothetical protein
LTQLREIYTYYGVQFDPEKRKFVEFFVHCGQSQNFLRRSFLAFSPHRFRASLPDEIIIRLIFLFNGFNYSFFFIKPLYFFVRRNVANFYFNYYREIPIGVRGLINVKILKKLDNCEIVKAEEITVGSKVAILAFYPRGSLINSNIRLIETLLRHDYQIIAVLNNSPKQGEWIQQLVNYPITLIKRPNMGRDFGAYKSAVKYLKDNDLLNSLENLLFANDSIVYGGNFESFFARYEQDSHPWKAAFINFEKHTHAQSFFQSFGKEILERQEFESFWSNYYPSDRRIHAIDEGEVRLSRTMINAGYFPSSIINAHDLLAKIDYSQIRDADRTALNKTLRLSKKSHLNTLPFDGKISRLFVEKNVTHGAGMLCSIVLGAPLKLDLVIHSKASKSAVRDTLLQMKIDPSEVENVLIDYGQVR